MDAEAILTPCQKVYYNESINIFIISLIIPYISTFILQQVWQVYIEGVLLNFLILCSPSIKVSMPYKKMMGSPDRFGIIYSSKLL